MYSHCIYCRSGLGSNRVLAHTPVGHRLAFDAARGRVWVVCPSCDRWNLTPLSDRWEAIEECSNRFEETPLRASSARVVLARLSDGTELIRIGRSAFPEFAVWRYGAVLRGRRQRLVRNAAAGATILATCSLLVGGPGLMVVTLLTAASFWWVARSDSERLLATIPRRHGHALHIRQHDLPRVRLVAETAVHPWRLLLPPETSIAGRAAIRALSSLMPHMNASGASSGTVRAALEEMAGVERPADYFNSVAQRYPIIAKAPRSVRLALEMAANEQSEELLMSEDLAVLTEQWRTAEEIAAIADRLLIPARVERALENLKLKKVQPSPSGSAATKRGRRKR